MTEPDGPFTIWDRVLAGDTGGLPAAAATYFVGLKFPAADHARMEVLNDKASESRLTDEERAELDEYLRVAGYLAILQSKARVALRRTAVVANSHG